MIPIITLTVRERRRQLVWMCLGMLLMAGMIIAMWPSFRDTDIAAMYQAMPESLRSMFGINETAFTGATFVNQELMSFMVPVILLIVAIGGGSSTIAGEEERGRMDVLLSTGLRRSQLLLGRIIGILIVLAIIVAFTWVVLVAGSKIVDLGLSARFAAEAMLMSWLLAAVYAGIAFAISGWTGRGSLTVGLASAIAVMSWLVSSLGAIVSSLADVGELMAFHAYADGPPIIAGASWSGAAMLAIEAVVLITVAVVGFARRDIR